MVPVLLAALEASDAIVIDVEDQGGHSVESIITALAAECSNVKTLNVATHPPTHPVGV